MKKCEECELRKRNEEELLQSNEDLREENDRYHGALIGLKNILEALVG